MADSKGNLFLNPKPNKREAYTIGAILILMVIFVIGYLQSSTLQNFGTIYFYLTIIIIIFMVLAIASRFKLTAKERKGEVLARIKFLGTLSRG